VVSIHRPLGYGSPTKKSPRCGCGPPPELQWPSFPQWLAPETRGLLKVAFARRPSPAAGHLPPALVAYCGPLLAVAVPSPLRCLLLPPARRQPRCRPPAAYNPRLATCRPRGRARNLLPLLSSPLHLPWSFPPLFSPPLPSSLPSSLASPLPSSLPRRFSLLSLSSPLVHPFFALPSSLLSSLL
jgi:hypothetical protein